MAAPVGGQIFSEILPYLEENKTENEKITEEQIETPDNLEAYAIKFNIDPSKDWKKK